MRRPAIDAAISCPVDSLTRFVAQHMIVPRRPEISVAILMVGGAGYATLCMPAIQQRGYPPLDPFWTAVTFVWVFPLLLSCWFDSWSFPSRRQQIWLYALGTAFFDAGTPVIMVPKSMSPGLMLLMTVFFFGPVHVAVSFALEAFVQSLLGLWRRVSAEKEHSASRPRFTLLAWVYLYTVVCAGIGFPIAFRSFVIRTLQTRGIAAAERDWLAGEGAVYGPPDHVQIEDVLIDYHVDRATGHWTRYATHDSDFFKSYNARMKELVERDSNRFRHRKQFPQPMELVEFLDSTELPEIVTFPCEVTRSIVVFRKGTVSRWGSTVSSGVDGLSIATEPGSLMAVGDNIQPVFVKVDQSQNYIVIRNGNTWVGVFLPDGRMFASAQRWP